MSAAQKTRGNGDRMGSTGLEGVVAATTQLSHVDGERGELIIAGYPVAELAEHATFEETTWLLWHGELPSRSQLETFRAALADARHLPAATMTVLRDCARSNLDVMDALRIAAGTLSLVSADATGIVARMPTIVASYWRMLRGKEPLAPLHRLGHAANFLYMLSGALPNQNRVRGLDTYLNTVID
ncbi:MAG: citrate/2-methylcitrate synthase, partial [Burkholderiales bacterium]